jgi:hypothetical protein
MSVTISALKRYSVRLYLQLFVGGLMSYLRYLCLFVHSGIQHILCCVFVFAFNTDGIAETFESDNEEDGTLKPQDLGK